MAAHYSVGETKVRPGVYFRETNGGSTSLIGTRNGVVAAAFKANWGPLGEVITIESPSEIAEYYGDDSAENSNVSILEKIFLGGASQIKAIRVGSGGTQAAITLKDDASTDVITLTALFAGTRPLSVTIKDSLSIGTQRECIVLSGTRELMKVTFAKGKSEVDALVDAINSNDAAIVTAKKIAAGSGVIAAITQTAFTTAGVSPEIANSDYSSAFAMLEATHFNTICVDTDDSAVHALLHAFILRAHDSGIMAMAVTGDPITVAYDTRKANAAAFNSMLHVHCINGFDVDDEHNDGWKAAAVIAGYVAYLPANDSPTHKVIPGATAVYGTLTNAQIVECLQSGCLVFTISSTGAVWIEQGINTLVRPTADQDTGWRKIRRTKTRFELMQRINEDTEKIVGSVGNDSNGRQTFVAIANGIISQMIAEGKLLAGEVIEDPKNPAKGDSAWFIVSVVDLDSIEKVYITYRFSFAEE
jgi:hypothetical protein